MPRADVVLNPISGASRGARSLAAFRGALRSAGWEVVLRPTERAGHGPDLAREAAESGADAVVAAGGDGTVSDVAAGLLAAGPGAPPLALLPRGTSNLVARELGVPFDAAGAARTVAGGVVRTLDVVRVAGGGAPPRTMVACAGVGWDAHVVRSLAERRRGHIHVSTWLAPILSALRRYDFPVFRVEADGAPPVACVIALFLNCRPYARFFVPAPGARPDDGLLDAVLVRPEGRRHVPRIAWRAWRGTLAGDPAVTAVRARSFRVTSDAPVPVHVDGDTAGETPADMLVRPAALRVLVPGAAEGASA